MSELTVIVLIVGAVTVLWRWISRIARESAPPVLDHPGSQPGSICEMGDALQTFVTKYPAALGQIEAAAESKRMLGADTCAGDWRGRYVQDAKETAFGLHIDQEAREIRGESKEEAQDGSQLTATIVGLLDVNQIRFTKTYQNLPGASPILYEGALSASGDKAKGQWRIASNIFLPDGVGKWQMRKLRQGGPTSDAAYTMEASGRLTRPAGNTQGSTAGEAETHITAGLHAALGGDLHSAVKEFEEALRVGPDGRDEILARCQLGSLLLTLYGDKPDEHAAQLARGAAEIEQALSLDARGGHRFFLEQIHRRAHFSRLQLEWVLASRKLHGTDAAIASLEAKLKLLEHIPGTHMTVVNFELGNLYARKHWEGPRSRTFWRRAIDAELTEIEEFELDTKQKAESNLAR